MGKKRILLLGAILLVIVLAALYFVIGRGNINGKVVDAEGVPVAGAIVEVAGNSILTDENGLYSISNVPPGRYRIAARKDGVGNLTTEVSVRFGMTTQADLALIPSP
jgi:hypothetical protein